MATGQYEELESLSPNDSEELGSFAPIYLHQLEAAPNSNIPVHSFQSTDTFLPYPIMIQTKLEYTSQPLDNSLPDLIQPVQDAEPSESSASSTPTTPTTPNNDGIETAPRGTKFIFIMEDPTKPNTFREKRQQTEEERAQQKEDFQMLKGIGGACIPCHRRKKKCGSGDPCPQCARSGRECIRKFSHASSGSATKRGKASCAPGPSQQADSHLQQLCKDNSAQNTSPSSNNSTFHDSNPTSAASETSNVDAGRISPVTWDLQGAYEGEDLMPFPGMSLLRRATYEVV